MAALYLLCTQMDKISNTLQNTNKFQTEVNRAEILHKAVGENTKHNEILRNDIKELSLRVDCQCSGFSNGHTNQQGKVTKSSRKPSKRYNR